MTIIRTLRLVFGNHRKLVWISYFLGLACALPAAWISYEFLGDTLGNSLSAERLIGDFDYSIWQDLRNHHSESLDPLWKCLSIMIPLGLLLTSCIQGGIYYSLNVQKAVAPIFLHGLRKFWWKYLSVSALAVVILGIWSIVVWRWYLSNLMNFLEYWRQDDHIVWTGMLLLIIWLGGLYFIFIWSNCTKVSLLQENRNPFTSFFTNLTAALKSSKDLFVSMSFLVLAGIVITIIYLLVSSTLKPSAVVMLVVLQQFVTWLKVGLRITAYEAIRNRMSRPPPGRL